MAEESSEELPRKQSPTPPYSRPLVESISVYWQRVNQRKVMQWSIAYAALALTLLHAIELVGHSFEWPEVIGRTAVLVLAIGFPIVATIAWYHGDHGLLRISRMEASIVALLLVIGTGLIYALAGASSAERIATAGASVAPDANGRALKAPSGTSVAVLPFTNLSGDTSQEFFSDGMTEEITTALAKVSRLHVVGRTSAFQFKNQNQDLRMIGQSLGATHLIEGSVRRAGDRVRITAQLIRADDGLHVWAESYDRELTDIFAIQEDIAQAIASALRVPLGLQKGQELVSNRSIEPDVYQQFLRAKALVRARGQQQLSDAIAMLEQVVGRDPNYGPAWALLAEAHASFPDYVPAYYAGDVDALRQIVKSSLPKADAAARRALELDPNSADANLSLGLVQALQFKWSSAEDLYSKALALDPNSPDALHRYSNLLATVGRLNEALALRQKLQELEPFVPVFTANTAAIMWVLGQDNAAVELFKGLPAPAGAPHLARINAASGRFKEAVQNFQSLPPQFPPELVADATHVLSAAPVAAPMSEALPRLGQLSWAFMYAGAPQRALEFEEGNAKAGYSDAVNIYFLWSSSYRPLRTTKRFKELMRDLGLVEYWRGKVWPPQCHPTTGDDFTCE